MPPAPNRLKIHPSPAIIARADSSIADCIALMREHLVGSVLIVSDDDQENLVGIFTERDLLKNFDLIDKGEHWKKPIRTVMTKPVRTLPVSKLDQATRVMIELGIRHLPIVSAEANAKQKVVGVLSMRDLFRNLAEEAERPEKSARKSATRPVIGVLSSTPHYVQLLAQGLAEIRKVRLERVSSDDFDELATLNVLLIDLDDLSLSDWAALLKRLNDQPGSPFTITLYDPKRGREDVLNIVKKLRKTNKLAVFSKPVAIDALFKLLHLINS